MKAKVDKIFISGLVKVPTGLNKLKTKIDNLDVAKLKTAPRDLKKKTNVVNKEVVWDTKFKSVNTKVNELTKKFLLHVL